MTRIPFKKYPKVLFYSEDVVWQENIDVEPIDAEVLLAQISPERFAIQIRSRDVAPELPTVHYEDVIRASNLFQVHQHNWHVSWRPDPGVSEYDSPSLRFDVSQEAMDFMNAIGPALQQLHDSRHMVHRSLHSLRKIRLARYHQAVVLPVQSANRIVFCVVMLLLYYHFLT
ncbi:hypothetical protein EUX98_g3812 [Antrodiella citrinella]|uniref:Uncharacterized protein n=1 Tax=Antrodiella citrinella TaxID=2447956 RepID=A0A4S4MY15_9APHY|nr:hypothetical protein EUX98_g3812 [Antrodiella citrinella]